MGATGEPAATASGALLAGCHSGGSSPAAPTADRSAATTAAPAVGATRRSILVAYYSAQGHTRAVAEAVAAELGADAFVIEPATAYAADDLDWTDSTSRVSTEHDNPDLRSNPLTVSAPAAFADYDTVLIGYPIWWGGASWAMPRFVSDNDFTAKTVIPFCTSQSSPIGASGTELARLAGTGDWQEGMRFPQDASATAVREWVASLGL